MKRILAEERGLGLAAQQVGSVWRVALLCLTDGAFSPKTTVVAINPRIVARSKKTVLSIGEGCLSVQARGRYFRTSVRRHEWVRLAYLDEGGNEHSVRLEGMDAVIAQHECDHLDGKCIVDGVSRQQRRRAERLVAKGSRR
jgi:peptide deformylase